MLNAQGDLAGAKEKYEEVLAIARETDDKHNAGYALFGKGLILALQGDLAGARKAQEESLAIRKEIGEPATMAESQLALAGIALEEKRWSEAEELAKGALAEFRAEKLKESEVQARIVLARAYVAQGKAGDARREMETAGGLAAKSSFAEVRLSYAIEAARVKGALGKAAEGRKGAEAVLAEAEKLGYREFVLEAKLAMGEMEIKMGRIADGRKRLEGVEKTAREWGYAGLARRARESSN